MASSHPHTPSFQPLIPLPSGPSTPPSNPLSESTQPPVSPFSSLFDPPPTSNSNSNGSNSATRPLFPGASGRPPRLGAPSLQSVPPPVVSPPSGESPTSTFGEFVSSDPLQPSLDFASFSPVQSGKHVRDASDDWNFVGANSFVQGAAARTKVREQKVMGELIGRDEDDPLGWLSGGPSGSNTQPAEPFDDWDGLEDDIMHDKQEKELEMLQEITDHRHQPHTPRASPQLKDAAIPYDSDEDIIDLKTGVRGRSGPKPIPISSGHHAAPQSRPQPHSSAGSYLGFTLPRKWFSSSVGPSPPQSSPGTSTSQPRADITRQSSTGEFTTLPPPDFAPFGGSEKTSPRPALSTIFDSAPAAAGPFSKKVFIPATGAPAFRPEENWNPSGFEFDSESKKDTLGNVKLHLVGRSHNTIPVLSQDVADSLRPFLPPLPRLSKSWSLLYSTDQHGMSISTLYKNVERYYGVSSCVLAVREATDDGDDDDSSSSRKPCFGVWLGSGMKCNGEAYYGSGESFLWKGGEGEGVKVFKWTGRNDYVALCESDYLSFGGGDGKYGLYVDSSFVDGTSERCDTFGNEILCGSEGKSGRARFECLALEVWRVGP